ncbi:MAG: alpha/beta hydrolase [Tindallia sp. MSAO_Bac2]|nr:MAG: alpha/beta hydrolase [Tindallia sp. MSAO_Bac2]
MTEKLEFIRQGEGPTLLFIHGLGSDRHCWDDAVELLKKDYHCVSLDLYGHGMNSSVPDTISLEKTAEELIDMLQQVKWKPSAIIGHSLGGMIALKMELMHPDLTERLVLMDTPTRQIRFWFLKRMVMNTLKKNFDKAIERQYAHMTGDMDLYHQLVATAKQTEREAYLKYMKSLLHTELHKEVKDIQVPIHLVLSRSLVPTETIKEKIVKKYGYGHIPEKNIHRSIKAGHFVMLEQPEAFVGTLRRILERSNDE